MCFPKLSKNINNMIYNTTPWPHAMLAKAMYREHLYRSSYATEARHNCRTIHTSTLKSHWGKKQARKSTTVRYIHVDRFLRERGKTRRISFPQRMLPKWRRTYQSPKRAQTHFETIPTGNSTCIININLWYIFMIHICYIHSYISRKTVYTV